MTALRFPCCGRAYPCDVCHDEDQDHPMELATRMICGYCAKEQVSYRLDTTFHNLWAMELIARSDSALLVLFLEHHN